MSDILTNQAERFAGSEERLLSIAAERCGLDDFGDDPVFRDGFSRLLAELDHAGLSADGAVATREFILSNLTGRLKTVAGLKARPDAKGRPIVRPLVVTGIVRSGTTALHKLLAMDPQFQGVEHWLCSAPQVRPPRDQWSSNPDFQTAKAALDAMIAISPETLEDHGMAVDTVEESINIHAHTFHSNMYPSQFDIPQFDAWWKATSDVPAYRYLADVLRLVGADTPGPTWLLKNPTDAFRLDDLVEVFPDAMIVQTHREPVQAVPSVVSLMAGAHRIFRGEDNIDYAKMFAREQEMWALAVDGAEAFKQANPGRVLDVEFTDFVTGQMGVVEAIYSHFGLTLTPETESAMQGWLDAHPRRSTSMQRFTAEDFGGSSDSMRERFAAYRQARGYSG